MLDVAVALAARRREPEIELLDVLVGAQGGGRAVHYDPTVFEDVAVTGVAQCDVGVLLGDQKADILFLVQPVDDAEDFLDELRRETQ